MPSFSFTAPIITPTEEQSERDGLDESMRRALHADVSGLPYSETSVGGPASHLSQSKFVKILETLPKRERSACLEVLKKAPGLFQSETPLSLYMGSECGQAEVRELININPVKWCLLIDISLIDACRRLSTKFLNTGSNDIGFLGHLERSCL